MKIAIATIIITLIILAAAFLTHRAGLWRFNYPNSNYTHGLDVSHHQGEIDWQAIDTEKYKFIYIKATEGGDFKDTKFHENWKGAKAAGMKTGAYHFFTLCRPGIDQAENFIKEVPNDKSARAPVIDLEFVGNCAKRPTKQEFLKELDDYAVRIVNHYQKQPVLYTTYEFYNQYLDETPYATYPIWLRDVLRTPSQHAPNWQIWQYADNARIAGINGPVDLNVLKQKP